MKILFHIPLILFVCRAWCDDSTIKTILLDTNVLIYEQKLFRHIEDTPELYKLIEGKRGTEPPYKAIWMKFEKNGKEFLPKVQESVDRLDKKTICKSY